jgi:hypothetical protein
VNIVAGPNKKVRVNDEEVLYELLQKNEYSSDSEISVKFLSCGEQCVSPDKEENISDSSSMQHGIWAKSGAE